MLLYFHLTTIAIRCFCIWYKISINISFISLCSSTNTCDVWKHQINTSVSHEDLTGTIDCISNDESLTNVCYSLFNEETTVCINPTGSVLSKLEVCQKGGYEADIITSSEWTYVNGTCDIIWYSGENRYNECMYTLFFIFIDRHIK